MLFIMHQLLVVHPGAGADRPRAAAPDSAALRVHGPPAGLGPEVQRVEDQRGRRGMPAPLPARLLPQVRDASVGGRRRGAVHHRLQVASGAEAHAVLDADLEERARGQAPARGALPLRVPDGLRVHERRRQPGRPPRVAPGRPSARRLPAPLRLQRPRADRGYQNIVAAADLQAALHGFATVPRPRAAHPGLHRGALREVRGRAPAVAARPGCRFRWRHGQRRQGQRHGHPGRRWRGHGRQAGRLQCRPGGLCTWSDSNTCRSNMV
mmetsp:Transcript_55255/g.146811  ORF Transcript_55255/g.146811 Transcript_55255/m.146811 type:complete len:266 (-) Transcript_55255:894-1691(-)